MRGQVELQQLQEAPARRAWGRAGAACARARRPVFELEPQPQFVGGQRARGQARTMRPFSRRASRKESGSSRSTGYSSSSSSSKTSGSSSGTSGRSRSPRASSRSRNALRAEPFGEPARGQRGQVAESGGCPSAPAFRRSPAAGRAAASGRLPRNLASSPWGTMLMPAKPRAAHTAASGLAAMAMWGWKRSSRGAPRHGRRPPRAGGRRGGPARRRRARRYPAPSLPPRAKTPARIRPAAAGAPGHGGRRTSLTPRAGFEAQPWRTARACAAPRRRAARRAAASSPARPTTPPRRGAVPAPATAQVLACGSRSTATSTVGVCSTARRSRNQEVREMRRAVSGGVSPRSIATSPKPPPCTSRSAALSAFSALPPQRTQSRRSSRTPAAAAEAGSKASAASTSAQTSSRAVACARMETSRLVRPLEAGPQISVRPPRGRPPVSRPLRQCRWGGFPGRAAAGFPGGCRSPLPVRV